MRRVVLKDAISHRFGDFFFKKDEPQEVADDSLYARLMDTRGFSEDPVVGTYWLESDDPLTVHVDGEMIRVDPDPVRVTKRQFGKFDLHLAQGRVRRVSAAKMMRRRPELRRVLVTRDMGAGDVLIATDVVYNLRQRFPDAVIDFATMRKHVCLLSGHPEIHATHVFGEVSALDYDVDIYLPRRSERFPECTRVPRPDIYLEEAGLLPVAHHETLLNLHVNELEYAEQVIREHSGMSYDPHWSVSVIRPRLALQPCGSGFHRSLDFDVAAAIAELAVASGWEVVVYGTGEHHWPHSPIPGVVNLCGKLSDIRAVAAVIARSNLLISPDSGGYHIAAALRPRVAAFTVFTTIDSSLRIRDYPNVRAMVGGPETLSCRPCNDHLLCSGRFECVRNNNPEKIWSGAIGWHQEYSSRKKNERAI